MTDLSVPTIERLAFACLTSLNVKEQQAFVVGPVASFSSCHSSAVGSRPVHGPGLFAFLQLPFAGGSS